MKLHVLLSFSAYYSSEDIKNWDCKWCKISKMNPCEIDTFYVKKSNLLSFIVIENETSTPSLLNLYDWINNFHYTQVVFEDVPNVLIHSGFYGYYLSFKDYVLTTVPDLISKHPEVSKIRFTGHSIGSSTAVLTMLAFLRKFENGDSTNKRIKEIIMQKEIKIFTFGCPRIGNSDFTDYFYSLFPKENFYRVVNQRDIVPSLPGQTMPVSIHYHHLAREYWFPNNDTTFVMCDGSGEDKTCSLSVVSWSIPDHLEYLGYKLGKNT